MVRPCYVIVLSDRVAKQKGKSKPFALVGPPERLETLESPTSTPQQNTIPLNKGNIGVRILMGMERYFRSWWRRKGRVIVVLLDDLLTYVCFVIFIEAVHFLLTFTGAHSGYSDVENHLQLHKWGFLTCDLVIVLALIRKLFILLVLSDD